MSTITRKTTIDSAVVDVENIFSMVELLTPQSLKGTMTKHRKTREVLQIVKRSYATLYDAIRTGKLRPPAKDASGDCVWTERDVQHARRVFGISRDGQKGGVAP